MPLLLTAVQLLIGQQKTDIIHMEEEVEQLSDANVVQERENSEMKRVAEQLNWTLNVIMSFENFPVKSFCPEHSE